MERLLLLLCLWISINAINMLRVFTPSYAVQPLVRVMTPPMKHTDRKGQMGRIAVIGGSVDYTGAPYYAAMASLKLGGDLAYIFCAKQAAIPIKSYSPEIMTTTLYDADINLDDGSERRLDQSTDTMKDSNDSCDSSHDNHPYILKCAQVVIDMFSRIHVMVIGPGLGRGHTSTLIVRHIIKAARSQRKPAVIDADGLWIVANDLSLIRGNENIILTPNLAEFDRLVEAAVREIKMTLSTTPKGASEITMSDGSMQSSNSLIEILKQLESRNLYCMLYSLARYLGHVTVVVKRQQDIVSDGREDIVYRIEAEGSPRRCGGQGDVFAGMLGVAVHWTDMTLNKTKNHRYYNLFLEEIHEKREYDEDDDKDLFDVMGRPTYNEDPQPPINPSSRILAVIYASSIMKRTSEDTFKKHFRSMTTPDVIHQIGRSYFDYLNEVIKRLNEKPWR